MATTVRVSEASHELLVRLAREADESITAVLDAALETYRRQRFLTAAAAAYEKMAADPGLDASYRRELAELDGSLGDG